MFTTILGIPAHPLLVHFAVVFVPLLIGVAVVYTLWPAARSRLDWALALLAVVAPFAAWFARISGLNFKQRLIDRKLTSPQNLVKIADAALYRSKNTGRNRVTATSYPAEANGKKPRAHATFESDRMSALHSNMAKE